MLLDLFSHWLVGVVVALGATHFARWDLTRNRSKGSQAVWNDVFFALSWPVVYACILLGAFRLIVFGRRPS